MARHKNPDVHRPVNDNMKQAGHAPEHSKREKHQDVPNERTPSRMPQATSMPGSLPIIHDVGKRSGGIQGVPGIISSTTTDPRTRQRLVGGIIEHLMRGSAPPSGPVCSVMGHDSTAYNTGMIHIAGSSMHRGR